VPAEEQARLLLSLADELAAIDDNAAAVAAYGDAYRALLELGHLDEAAAVVPALVAARHLLGAGLADRVVLLRGALSETSNQPVRARLLAALSAAYMLDRRLTEAIEFGEAARAEVGGDEIATSVNVDTTLGSVLVFAGRMTEGWDLLTGATQRAARARMEAEAARAYRMLGSSSSVLVEYDIASAALVDGVTYAERTERWNDRNYMAAHHAHVLWATGQWSQAEAQARFCLADGGGITTRVTALYVLGYLALGRAEWDRAAEHLTEAHSIGEQMRELQRLSPPRWGLAELALRQHRVAASIALCEQGFAASAEVHDAAYLFPYLVTGVRAHLAADDSRGARAYAHRVTAILDDRAIPGTLPAIRHAHGLLALAEGRTGQAHEALAEALAGWDERGRFWEGTQALIDLAVCAHRSKRAAEAASLLEQARNRADRTGADALLSACDDALRAGTDAVLSARELEVAQLVATGATNRQIAQALFIAPKTVSAHVEHILAKLGAARRAEIAAWVTRATARK
jgi:DNA-binding CsgD family transcriptional regulator